MLMVIGPDDSLLFEFGKSMNGDGTHLSHQLLMYASLDLVEDAVWITGDCLLPAIDRTFDGKYHVSAYVGFAPIKLLLMQEQEPNKRTRELLVEVYNQCVRHLLNPLSSETAPFCPGLRDKLRRLYERFS